MLKADPGDSSMADSRGLSNLPGGVARIEKREDDAEGVIREVFHDGGGLKPSDVCAYLGLNRPK